MLFWFGWSVLADAAITVAMVETMAIAFPILAEPVPRALFIVALFIFLAAVNIIGVRSGVRLFVFNTIAKLVPLVLLAVVGLFVINIEYLAIKEWPSLQNVGVGALILFFAFAGAESALIASGEIKIGWLLLQLTREEAIGLAALIGVSVVIYAIRTVVPSENMSEP